MAMPANECCITRQDMEGECTSAAHTSLPVFLTYSKIIKNDHPSAGNLTPLLEEFWLRRLVIANQLFPVSSGLTSPFLLDDWDVLPHLRIMQEHHPASLHVQNRKAHRTLLPILVH